MTEWLARLDAALTGRYRIVRELGHGGMATVYLAEDQKHHRQVAVKMLRPEIAETVGAERFLREIEIAANLQHPHILPLYDSGGAGDVLFYVMPFVEGHSLRDRLVKTGALPIDEAVRIIREVADGLAYSHGHGVVHRDIKPENVLLSGTHALVMDFGVAKALSDAVSAGHLTGTGVTLGTPAYMAPEQAMADPALDHRVDIYALGVMAYELLVGQPPFHGTNPQQVIAGHLARRPDPLSTYRPTVSPALEGLVMRCLEKNPADRWQSAEAILHALDAVATPNGTVVAARTDGSIATSTAPAPAARTRSTRGRRWLIGGAFAAMAIAGVGAAWFARVGRAGTLIGDDVLAPNDLVLVADFENRTGDTSLAATVTDAIRMDLHDSRAVRVMSQAAMWAGLERMGLGHGTYLPQPQVQELAEREGAKAFVVGSVARVGGGYQITARVVATNGGTEALAVRLTARDSTALIGAVEDVGRKLRRGIGESLRSVLAAPPLAQVTTASLPALRAYSASRRAETDGQRPRAVALAKEALSIDSAFAMAWAGLYTTYNNMGFVRLATEAAERAYSLRDHLSEFERLRIEAIYHATRGEPVEEEARWQRLAELGRDEATYSDMLLGQRRLQEAEAMARRAVASEPKNPVSYWNLAEAQVGQHHFVGADSTTALIAAQLPDNTYRYSIPISIRWARRDLDAVSAYLQSADGAHLPEPFRVTQQCMVDLYRGRIGVWQRCPIQERQMVFRKQYPRLATAEFRMTGDTSRARTVYAPFLAAAPNERDPDQYPVIISLLADVGHVREARQLLDDWRARAGPTDLGFRADSAQAVGAIAAAERQWGRATAAFLAWNTAISGSAIHLYNRGLPEAATILARRGQSDSAIVLFERALATSSLYGGSFYEASWYSQALAMLGDLYEARGNRAKAIEYYQRYVELLEHADPPLAAQVALMRDKVVRLTGESGALAKP